MTVLLHLVEMIRNAAIQPLSGLFDRLLEEAATGVMSAGPAIAPKDNIDRRAGEAVHELILRVVSWARSVAEPCQRGACPWAYGQSANARLDIFAALTKPESPT